MKTLKLLMMLLAFITLSSCKAEVKKELATVDLPVETSPTEKQFIRVALLLDTSNRSSKSTTLGNCK